MPGYVYHGVRMRASSFFLFPTLELLSQEMASMCSVKGWDIGLDVVLYRDGNDTIGKATLYPK